MKNPPVLLVVDLQRYYVEPEANFRRYPESRDPDSFQYVAARCRDIVIPNVKVLLGHFRKNQWPVIFLRLCGEKPDRSDLHPIFRRSFERAEQAGYPGLYPLASEALADVIPEVAPLDSETVIDKVTFSGFTSSPLEDVLIELEPGELVFCGLATSQCVDTTARDASDRGYRIVHVGDAQADYSETSHRAALFASQGVCGGCITSTEEIIATYRPADLLPW